MVNVAAGGENVDQDSAVPTLNDSDSKTSSPSRATKKKSLVKSTASSRDMKVKNFKTQKSSALGSLKVINTESVGSIDPVTVNFETGKTDVIIEETDHEDNTNRSNRTKVNVNSATFSTVSASEQQSYNPRAKSLEN